MRKYAVRFRVISCFGALMALASASQAAASTTIGQLAPPNPPNLCVGGPNDALQASLGGGNPYTVPAGGGAITSWSTNAGAGLGQTLKLKVFRPISGTTYQVVAHDGPRALIPSTLNTFGGLNIPVQAGDLIGLNDQNAPAVNNACLFNTGLAADIFAASASGDAADGISETITPVMPAPGNRLNISAVVGVKPSNADTLGKLKRNKRKGTATLSVSVPGPGTLALTGKGVKTQRDARAAGASASLAVSGAGTVTLKIKPKGTVKKKLNKKGRAKVKVTVTYTPNGTSTGDLIGDPNTQSKRVKLIKRL